MNWKDKTVLVGISGGIAAYKTAYLVSRLVKTGADVHVIMTENATKFIAPLTFETLSGNACPTDTFERKGTFEVKHVELAKKADVFIVAPATANVIAKFAHGIADDMLTTTVLAAQCPKIVAPAMNTRMFENPVTQENMKTLERFGIEVIQPQSGYLACGDTGKGKMPEPDTLFAWVERAAAGPKDMKGMKVVVSAGATRESMDPVRFITNHSTGKMGFSMARECMLRGADVTIVRAAASAEPPLFCRIIDVKSAEDMFQAVTEEAKTADLVIMAAAVADYTPANYSDEKVKKKDGDLSIPLKRTKDILGYLGEHRHEGQFLCGFSMETENMVENSRAKLQKKNCDMIIANNLKVAGAGFGTDTNIVTLITRDDVKELSIMSKDDVAHEVIGKILESFD